MMRNPHSCARYGLPDIKVPIHTDRTPGIDTLSLNLFGDSVYTGVIQKVDENLSGSPAWSGYLDGIAFSSFVLVNKGDVIMGTSSFRMHFTDLDMSRMASMRF